MLLYVFLTVSALFSVILSLCCFSGAGLLLMIPIFLASLIVILILYGAFIALASLFIDMERTYTEPINFFRTVTIGALDFFLTVTGGRIHISGKEKLPKEPYLMVLNHRSLMDPVTGLVGFKKERLTFVSKVENRSIPIIGRYLHAIGTLELDRDDARKALKTINDAADMIKEGRSSIAICPEGTRNRTEQPLLEFHAGSFKIVQKAKCPLVVACFRNTEEIKKHPVYKKTDIFVDILGVKTPEELAGMRTADMAGWSWNLMNEHLRSVEK